MIAGVQVSACACRQRKGFPGAGNTGSCDRRVRKRRRTEILHNEAVRQYVHWSPMQGEHARRWSHTGALRDTAGLVRGDERAA